MPGESRFTDYMLALLHRLYELDGVEEGGTVFDGRHHFDAEKLTDELGWSVPAHWPREAAAELERQLLVTLTPAAHGYMSIHAAITARGRVEIEDSLIGKKLTFTEFMEFLLARFYELDDGKSGLVDAVKISEELLRPVPASWPFDAVKALGDRGLVVPALAMASALATITGEGRLKVEASRRNADSVVSEYDRHPERIVIVHGDHNQIAVDTRGGVNQSIGDDRSERERS